MNEKLPVVILTRTETENLARHFAMRVQREVCIRSGWHGANGPEERRQRTEGPVTPAMLDCVQEAILK